MRFISEEEARAGVTMAAAIEAIDGVFRDLDRGEAEVFPVTTGHGSDPADGFAVKPGLLRSQALLGLKVGTYWPRNPARGLPSHGSTTLILDDATGFPRAVVSATHLTALRTAAADAVAVRALARPDADVLAVVGAGHQAWFDAHAICAVRPIASVRVWGRNRQRAESFAERLQASLGLATAAMDLSRAVAGAGVIACVTAAREPLLSQGWVAPGTHISAMGADSPGKQELAADLVAGARLFADVVVQSVSIGEFQSAAAAGRVSADQITPLGAVLNGRAEGRRNADEITIFDSSGMALQDLTMAALALKAADSPPG